MSGTHDRLRESLGISADGSEKAFKSEDVEAFMKRVPKPILYNPRDPRDCTFHFFTAVDPCGGGASAFSIATIAQTPDGFIHVRPRS